jgi:hypothetical protein
MKTLGLWILLIFPAMLCWAEPQPENVQPQEPTLYDHFHSLKRMQESLAGRSLEEQARMRPQIQRAERQACQRLRKDRLEQVSKEGYRRQGGDEFLVFAQQFEQYCETMP